MSHECGIGAMGLRLSQISALRLKLGPQGRYLVAYVWRDVGGDGGGREEGHWEPDITTLNDWRILIAKSKCC